MFFNAARARPNASNSWIGRAGRRAEVFDRTIDVQISRLRKKIDIGDVPLFKTLRNSGYMLAAPVKET